MTRNNYHLLDGPIDPDSDIADGYCFIVHQFGHHGGMTDEAQVQALMQNFHGFLPSVKKANSKIAQNVVYFNPPTKFDVDALKSATSLRDQINATIRLQSLWGGFGNFGVNVVYKIPIAYVLDGQRETLKCREDTGAGQYIDNTQWDTKVIAKFAAFGCKNNIQRYIQLLSDTSSGLSQFVQASNMEITLKQESGILQECQPVCFIVTPKQHKFTFNMTEDELKEYQIFIRSGDNSLSDRRDSFNAFANPYYVNINF